MTESRVGLAVAVGVDKANGRSEREAGLRMVTSVRRQHRLWVRTLGGDGGFDAESFLRAFRSGRIVPYVGLRPPRFGATDANGFTGAEMRSMQCRRGYRMSLQTREVVERFFGREKPIAEQTRWSHVGRWKIGQQLELRAVACTLVRMRRLLAA